MAEKSSKAESIFWSAMKIGSPEERATYLDRACGGDDDLRLQLDELLAAYPKVERFLEHPAIGSSRTLYQPVLEKPGDQIGAYKLLQEIGQGGMGVVYMAEQTEPIRRKVALKIIKPGMDTRQVIARFEAERQALSLMDHPHIAKVLDAGTTDSGRPYFVMELVKGQPITEYCDAKHLTPRQRLELLLPVCHAIQHAHLKGIIHRDVKPTNILVAEYDQQSLPKVIDFGVAKAISQPLTEKTMFTGHGQIIGTVEYMSPEQAKVNQLDIDTRSDIYSLGVLLYELLTGTTPFDKQRLHSAAWDEMLRIIREEEPPKPSVRLSESKESLPSISAQRHMEPATLTHIVRGELDWIVMKALEKDRNRRYETANGFAIDLQRYLANEPVSAGPPTAWYRFRKFARRNNRVLASAVTFLLLLVGATAVSICLASWALSAGARMRQALAHLRSEQQKTKAALVQVTAEQKKTKRALEAEISARQQTREALNALTDDVIETMFARQPDFGEDEKAFLRKVIEFYETLASDLGDTEESRDTAADGKIRVARLRGFLGEPCEASADYRDAIRLLEKLAADFPAVPRYRHSLARSYADLGNLIRELGQRQEAEVILQRGLDILEQLVADAPNETAYSRDLAATLTMEASVLRYLGHRQQADAAFRRALVIQEKLVAEFPGVRGYRYELAVSHLGLGTLLPELGKWPEAEASLDQGVEILVRLVAECPMDAAFRNELADGYTALGELYRALGKLPESEQALRQALQRQEQLVRDFPTARHYRATLAQLHNSLGNLLSQSRKWEEAETAHRDAVTDFEKLVADFPEAILHRAGLAASYNDLGALLYRLGRIAEAEAAYRAALQMIQPLVDERPDDPSYRRKQSIYQTNLGNVLTALGELSEAETAFREAIEMQEHLVRDFPEAHEYQTALAGSYCNFGILLNTQQRPQDSLGWFTQAIRILEASLERNARLITEQLFLRNSHWSRASAFKQLNRHAEALSDLDRAIELTDLPDQPALRLERAWTLARLGEHARAVAETDELTQSAELSGAALYDAACVYGLSATAAKEQPEVHAQYAWKSVALLRRAQSAGFFEEHKAVERLQQGDDFAALRDREDFKNLVHDLEAAMRTM